MGNIIGVGPAVRAQPTTTVQRPSRHDGLCIEETQSYGMAYCWCVKPCCWHPEGQRREKRRGSSDPDAKSYREPLPPRLKGRCICRHCPCHDPLYLLPSMGTIQAEPQDPPSKRRRQRQPKA
jgi:hypothetical protein